MKKKFDLKQLEVKSFITNMDSIQINTVKGGITGARCETQYVECTEICSGTGCQ